MFFQKLPSNVQEAIKNLTVDNVFQERFGKDPILDALDDEKNNISNAFKELISTFNFKLRYKDKKYNNLTPAIWCYLWCIESPFVKSSKKEPTQADLDFFFYVLENGVDDISVVEVAAKSLNFCQNNGIDQDEAVEVIHILSSNAFSPLKMFPNNGEQATATEPVFDSDWLTALISKVHSVTGYAPDYIANKMSLTACCFYYAQYARMQGTQHIEKRAPEEILKAQDERACELILDRLEELKVVKHEDRAEFFKIMTTIPENK